MISEAFLPVLRVPYQVETHRLEKDGYSSNKVAKAILDVLIKVVSFKNILSKCTGIFKISIRTSPLTYRGKPESQIRALPVYIVGMSGKTQIDFKLTASSNHPDAVNNRMAIMKAYFEDIGSVYMLVDHYYKLFNAQTNPYNDLPKEGFTALHTMADFNAYYDNIDNIDHLFLLEKIKNESDVVNFSNLMLKHGPFQTLRRDVSAIIKAVSNPIIDNVPNHDKLVFELLRTNPAQIKMGTLEQFKQSIRDNMHFDYYENKPAVLTALINATDTSKDSFMQLLTQIHVRFLQFMTLEVIFFDFIKIAPFTHSTPQINTNNLKYNICMDIMTIRMSNFINKVQQKAGFVPQDTEQILLTKIKAALNEMEKSYNFPNSEPEIEMLTHILFPVVLFGLDGDALKGFINHTSDMIVSKNDKFREWDLFRLHNDPSRISQLPLNHGDDNYFLDVCKKFHITSNATTITTTPKFVHKLYHYLQLRRDRFKKSDTTKLLEYHQQCAETNCLVVLSEILRKYPDATVYELEWYPSTISKTWVSADSNKTLLKEITLNGTHKFGYEWVIKPLCDSCKYVLKDQIQFLLNGRLDVSPIADVISKYSQL